MDNMRKVAISVAISAMLAINPLIQAVTRGEVQSWKMYGAGPRHTFSTPDAIKTPLRLDWEYKTGGGFLSQSGAAHQKGIYYIPLTGGQLQAVDESTGKVIWKREFEKERLNTKPVPSGDYVVIATQSGKVHVLLASSGQIKWTYNVESEVSNPPVVQGRLVLVATDDGKIFRLTLNGLYYTGLTKINSSLSAQPLGVSGSMICVATKDGRISLFDRNLQILWFSQIDDQAVGTLCQTNAGITAINKRGMVYCLDVPNGKTLWQLNIGNESRSGLVTDGSFIYTASMRGNLFAIDPGGDVKWKVKVEGDVISRPVVSAGKIYTGTLSRQVFCHTTSDGSFLWSARTDQSTYSGLTASNKTILVLPRVGQGSCFGLSNGSKLWSLETGSSGRIPPVSDGEHVYAAMNDGALVSLGIESGDLGWSKSVGREINSPPAISGKRIIIGTTDENLVCLETDSGRQVWKTYVPYYINSPPSVAGKYAFIGTWGGEVISLDLATGSRIWSQVTNAEIKSSPSISQRGVFIGSWDSNLYSFDYQSGTLSWKFPTTYNIDRCISLGQDQGYLPTKDKIVCIQLRDGSPLWFLKLDSPVASEIAMNETNIFAVTTGGFLYSINGKTGKVNWKTRIDTTTSPKNLIIFKSSICLTAGTMLRLISMDSGKVSWQYDCETQISAPVYANGRLLLSTDIGSVMCFTYDNSPIQDSANISNEIPLIP